jgi:hypothetical protein
MTFAQAWEVAGAAIEDQADAVRRFFDTSTQAARELLEVNGALAGEIDAEGSAVERLNRLIEEQIARREAEAKAVGEVTRSTDGLKIAVGELQRLREAERLTKDRLLALDRQKAAVEGDFTRTEAQKFAARRAILERETALLAQIVAQLRERASLAGIGAQEREQILARADSFDQQLGRAEGQLQGLGADPPRWRSRCRRRSRNCKTSSARCSNRSPVALRPRSKARSTAWPEASKGCWKER